MKKIFALLSTTLLAGGLSTSAWAAQPGCEEVPMMRGTISSLDPITGRIELRTEQGPVQAYFTPEALPRCEGNLHGNPLDTRRTAPDPTGCNTTIAACEQTARYCCGTAHG